MYYIKTSTGYLIEQGKVSEIKRTAIKFPTYENAKEYLLQVKKVFKVEGQVKVW